MAPDVFIALGSNVGNRRANLRRGLALLVRPPQGERQQPVRVLAASALYESAPAGRSGPPSFLNAAVHCETSLSATELLDVMQSAERSLGRRPGPRWGPRPLDLDLLAYDDAVVQTDRLTLPHPRIRERGFVLQPLMDLDPDLTFPGWTGGVRQALAALNGDPPQRLAGPEWVATKHAAARRAAP